MQLKKALNGLLLTLPVIAVVACSSSKNNNNEQTGIGANNDVAYGTGTAGNDTMYSDEHAHLQMQQLHQNNIIYFGLDKYDVQSDYVQMLDHHVVFLRNNPSYKVTIEGHADERGTPEYNIALGERRANAIKIYLQSRGISADQIFIVSYGKEKPAVTGHDEAAYSKNRRAIVIY